MCQQFSCIVLASGKVLWKWGVDSHADILTAFGIPDNELPAKFAKVEISPANGSYLQPDKWVFKLDEEVKPEWWSDEYQKDARQALNQWKIKLNRILVRKLIVNPFNDIKPPQNITSKHLDLVKVWASLGDSRWASDRDSAWAAIGGSLLASVGPSVYASVYATVAEAVGSSVADSVSESVGSSVGDSLWASAWISVDTSVTSALVSSVTASVWAYLGSFFSLPRKAWKYTGNIKIQGYPFQPAVDLWRLGLVPVFDGEAWRLLGGKKAKTLWRGKI